jgi:hypothetical protein
MMSDDEVMREILRFSGHKFVIRMDGQQIVALIATIDLASRNPNFRGPTRQLAEQIAEHLRRIAGHEAPELDLVQSVCNVRWIPDEDIGITITDAPPEPPPEPSPII